MNNDNKEVIEANRKKMRLVNDSDTNFHDCHQCGKREKWNDFWCWCYEVFGKGYSGYEIVRRFCSDECHTNWKSDKRKKKKKQ